MQNSRNVDAFDRKILATLASEGALTNHGLAERVGLSESQCYRRRLRLEQSGAIRGYRAVVDPAVLGFTVMGFVQLNMVSQSTTQREELAIFLRSQIRVLSCHAVTGDSDFILRVQAADLSDLNVFINSLLALGKTRMNVRSIVVLETIKDS
jgi:DNA-binding Lrp family transcriptional regulator